MHFITILKETVFDVLNIIYVIIYTHVAKH